MKVEIGPFPQYDEETQKYDIKKRKIDINIDRWDTWSMDHTLALIIHPMLIHLKENSHSYGMVDDKDVPKRLRIPKGWVGSDENGYMDDNGSDRWQWVLDEMIWTFEQIASDDAENHFYTGHSDIIWTDIDVNGNEITAEEAEDIGNSYVRMDRGPEDTFKFDSKGFAKYSKRIKRGTKLFGKYFQALWD